MNSIIVTNDKKKMEEIGRRIAKEKIKIYTPLMIRKLEERIWKERKDLSQKEFESLLYCSIYDYWVYGNNIDEEFYYRFYEKTHQEKITYMTNRVRLVYMDYMCCGGVVPANPIVRQERIELLENKYKCYKKLEPYYKRDIIEICKEDDFELFEDFVRKHPVFVVKPSDFYYGIGVHKTDINNFRNTTDAFRSILDEGIDIKKKHPALKSSLVLEELIVQVDELASLHPSSINGIRVTAVIDKNGQVILLHPWIKCGAGGQFVASAALDGFDAEIDADTGIVISDGYSENGKIYEVHPDTGIRIKGFAIPQWEELKKTVEELMHELPDYRYIGWDFVLTKKGWVVMEANYSGEFMWQLIRQSGGKNEFEEIIGWKMENDFWWQIRPYIPH